MASSNRPLHQIAVSILTQRVSDGSSATLEDILQRETAAKILLGKLNAADEFYVCEQIYRWLRCQAWRLPSLPYPDDLLRLVARVLRAHDPQCSASLDQVLLTWQKKDPRRFAGHRGAVAISGIKLTVK